MVHSLVISKRHSHLISRNIQKYISQTYNNSNFDRLKNYKKSLSMLMEYQLEKF